MQSVAPKAKAKTQAQPNNTTSSTHTTSFIPIFMPSSFGRSSSKETKELNEQLIKFEKQVNERIARLEKEMENLKEKK